MFCFSKKKKRNEKKNVVEVKMTKMVEVVGTRQDVGEKRVMKEKCSTKIIIITKIGGKCYFSCIAVFFKKDL